MTQNTIDYFADLLRGMREQILRKPQTGLTGSDDTEASHLPDVADRASMESDRNLSLLLRERDRLVLKEIQQALARMDDGEYGVCEECGEDIDPARLRAQPTATLCQHCKSRLEEETAYHLHGQPQAAFSFSQ